MKRSAAFDGSQDSSSKTPYRAQVLERAFAILDLLSERDEAFGLSEVSRRLHLNKATVHRLLSVLERHQYVERNTGNGAYHLGSKLFELGNKAVSRLGLIDRARPFLARLVSETGETAHLAVLRHWEVISLANVESPRTLRTPATVGQRSPAYCTSVGKAILALASDAEVDRYLQACDLKKYTSRTITAPAEFRRELRRVRKRGYAIDDEEYEDGLKCIGMPVRDHSGAAAAAISVTGPAFRLTDDRTPDLIECIRRVAAELSAALGHLGE